MADQMPPLFDKIACSLVFNQRGEVLLLKRSPGKLGGGKWGVPGGKLDQNETPLEAVARELLEESGLFFDHSAFRFLGTHIIHMPHGNALMDSFFVRVDGRQAVLINQNEHDAFTWAPLHSLHSGTDLLWGLPTILHHFGFIILTRPDPTLADGSTIVLLDK